MSIDNGPLPGYVRVGKIDVPKKVVDCENPKEMMMFLLRYIGNLEKRIERLEEKPMTLTYNQLNLPVQNDMGPIGMGGPMGMGMEPEPQPQTIRVKRLNEEIGGDEE